MSDSTQVVKVRLVETYYKNRLEREDGPMSLQNIVSDSSSRYKALGVMTMAEAEALTKQDLEDEGYDFEEDSDDGFEEFGYKLQYFDPAEKAWRFLKNFW